MIIQSKKNILISVFVIAGFFLAIAFNNCGKSQGSLNLSTQLDSYENKEVFLIQQFQGKLDQEFCYSSTNYSCVRKVFSQNINYQDLGSSQSECIHLLRGGEICPEIRNYTYNSKAAQSACQENCQESYEYEEYDCHLKLGSVARVFPLVTTENTLSKAIEKLNQSCVHIQEGNQ